MCNLEATWARPYPSFPPLLASLVPTANRKKNVSSNLGHPCQVSKPHWPIAY